MSPFVTFFNQILHEFLSSLLGMKIGSGIGLMQLKFREHGRHGSCETLLLARHLRKLLDLREGLAVLNNGRLNHMGQISWLLLLTRPNLLLFCV